MGACCCMGPQNGDPVCPCKMKFVKIVNGRYVTVTDLGPVPSKPIDFEFFLKKPKKEKKRGQGSR